MALQLKVPAIAGTLVGTALGAVAVGVGVATLPIALPAGAAAGVLVDVLRRKHHVAVTVASPPPPAVMQMIVRAAPPSAPSAAVVTARSTQASAAPPIQAILLHAYLHINPASKIGTGGLLQSITNATNRAKVVRDFQSAFNIDANAVAAFGGKRLTVDGIFDAPTAAALAFFTHDPIPADPAGLAPTHAAAPPASPSADASADLSLNFST